MNKAHALTLSYGICPTGRSALNIDGTSYDLRSTTSGGIIAQEYIHLQVPDVQIMPVIFQAMLV